MEHEFRQVDILNDKGEIIGQKPRRDINKRRDIHHTAYVLLITPSKELVISLIPVREDLPNLYANQYGTTMATIRRHGESAEEAARRGLARELFIDDAKPVLISQGMVTLDGWRRLFASCYVLQAEMPVSYSELDVGELSVMTRRDFEQLLANDPARVAPTLRLLWQKYGTRVPAGQ